MELPRRRVWGSLAATLGVCAAVASCRVAVGSTDSPAPTDAATTVVGLMGCDPATAGDACVRSFIMRAGQRAWRRPLTVDEVSTLDAVYTQGRVDFDVPTSAQMVLQVMRSSR